MVLDIMKKIGILGGLSAESTVYYYQYIIRKYTERFGDYSYPEIIIYSVNFQKYINWGKGNNWDTMADDMVKSFGFDRGGEYFGQTMGHFSYRGQKLRFRPCC